MSQPFQTWAQAVLRLHAALAPLESSARLLEVADPAGQEWFELLAHKLLPQVEVDPLLVVAVVGGTNIGKSALFNQLAGEEASGVSPLAAGTKHPVCLVPEGAADPAQLARLFQGFRLCPWHTAEEPLAEADEDRLYWRVGRHLPPRLLLLDTPDVDSDREVNWRRADYVRRAADVLVAVLTQQKYNDAAVKRFFRHAAAADKTVVVVFNQCDMQADRNIWPQWLHTFCEGTSITPLDVLVVPYDRLAVTSRELAFFSVGRDGRQPPSGPLQPGEQFAQFAFDAIKLRALRGAALRVTDPRDGAASYVATLRDSAHRYATAERAISSVRTSHVIWPTLPPQLMIAEIRRWWDERRTPWSRKVHGFYRSVGESVTRPARWLWHSMAGKTPEPLEGFHAREREAVIEAVGSLVDELARLGEVSQGTLQVRLRELLTGDARRRLLEQVLEAQSHLPPVDEEFRGFLRRELHAWSRDNPRAENVMRMIDSAMAVARPAITVTLALGGLAVAQELAHSAAITAAGHLATEAAAAGGAAVAGEAAVSGSADGLRLAAARLFHRLQADYSQRRALWLSGWLEKELLGETLSTLRHGAAVAESKELREFEDAIAAVREATE